MGYGEDKGIIPIACERIFDNIKNNKDPDLTIRVEASMLEIYMEKVKDLFNPNSGDLKVRLNPAKGFYIENLTKNAVADYNSISKLMDAGSKARTVAATNMNATSSRAHTIFQIMLTQTKIDRNAGSAKDKTALINLIDLAGSERADSTGATGERLKEGSAINLSLSSLGNVISALAANSDPDNKKKVRVPFRDSVLTMLLENSLGGNSKTAMIAAVSPADINYDETLSTLRYADRAKQIKNKAVVNEDPNEKLIRGLRDEIEALKKALASGGLSLPGSGGTESLIEEERKKLQAEMEEERERMRKELEEKIKQELEESKTWDQKLADTKARQESREKELAEMGVLTGAAREEQLLKAKSIPHMMNLNEDSQLDKQIIYFFEPGKNTTIGRKDSDNPKDIKLSGLSIQKDHAIVHSSDDSKTITIEPASNMAKIYVNGTIISSKTPLRHGTRVVFGTSHVYYVIIPHDADAGVALDGISADEVVDYTFAINEMNKAQVQALALEEGKRRAEAEEERRKAEQRVAEIEARMEEEKRKAAEEAETRIKAMEEKARALAGNEEQLKQLKEAQEKLALEAKAKQAELEAALRAQVEETQRLQAKKEKAMRERSLLDEKLLKTIPLVNEANAISDELQKHMNFEPKLMSNTHTGRPAAAANNTTGSAQDLDTDVFVKINHTDVANSAAIWSYGKFVERLYLMREVYQQWVENGRKSLSNSDSKNDPFFDPPEDTLIGKATIYLDSLRHMLPIEEATPIINYAGKEHGELVVRIMAHTAGTPPASAIAVSEGKTGNPDDDELEEAESIEELKGRKVGISIFVDSARGLPTQSTLGGTYVKFQFFLDENTYQSTDSAKKTINPRWGWYKTLPQVVTDEFIKYVSTEPLTLEVWGHPGDSTITSPLSSPKGTDTTAKSALHTPVTSPTTASHTPAPSSSSAEVKSESVPKTEHTTAKVTPETTATSPPPPAKGGCCTIQ